LLDELSWEPSVTAAHIGVSANAGVVTLTGHVDNDPDNVNVTAKGGRVKLTGTVRSWQERQTAASTAWAAPGAIAVESELAVV
jgi:osmotically-inducible protein OsmY